jgi:hypothetical protein
METVIRVVANEQYQLEIEFSSGENRLFDALPYLSKGIFTRLLDKRLFMQAYVALDTVCWPGEIDIAPETLYDRSVPLC